MPVFREKLEEIETTQSELTAFLQYLKKTRLTKHLEAETYTFDVLPAVLNKQNVEDNISRELNWLLEGLA